MPPQIAGPDDTRAVPPLIENHSVDYVPPNERYGKPRTLLTYWFSVNACAATVSTGAIGLFLGASLGLAVAAIVVGNLIGALFMAYHSAQGPKLGLPQMIQSRAQFGFFGSALPNVLAIVTLVGYFINIGVLGGQALAGLLHSSLTIGVIVYNSVVWALVTLGYRAIHRINSVMAVVSIFVMAFLAVRIASQLHGNHSVATSNTFGTFLLLTSIAVSWQVTYAPLVSEFSRYLPESTSVRRAVTFTYAGSAFGAVVFMTLGAMAADTAVDAVSSDTSAHLASLLPGPVEIGFLLLGLQLVAANCENIYGSYTTIMATASLAGGRLPASVSRPLVVGIIAVATGFVEVAISGHLLTNLTNFLSFILYLLIPWTAINLVDYYFIRKGRYNIGAILTRGGEYGLVNWPSLGVYAIATLVQIPFMNTAVYASPIATRYLGGGDIAWILGLLVGGGLYYAVARFKAASRVDAPTAQLGRPPAFTPPKEVIAQPK
jgi:nucleobase:cation symporter-1, NCS1 family